MALRSAGKADPDRVGRLSNDANRRPGADPPPHQAIIARIGLRASGCCPCQGIATPRTVPLGKHRMKKNTIGVAERISGLQQPDNSELIIDRKTAGSSEPCSAEALRDEIPYLPSPSWRRRCG